MRISDERDNPMVGLDSADAPAARGPEPERLKIDGTFEDAARKLARTPPPEGGWPKPTARKRKPKG